MNNYKLVTVLNTEFKPIQFKLNGKLHYQIFLNIEPTESSTIDEIEKVDYYLHSSFKKRLRSSSNKNSNFRIEFKAWGVFNVKVVIFKSNGTKEEFIQSMKHNFRRESIIL